MGRKSKPTSLRQGHKAINHDEPMPPPGKPECPADLEPEAAAEWERLANVLEEMNLLSVADHAGLLMYCRQYQKWMEAERKVREFGPIVAAPKTKVPMINLWNVVANQAYDRLAKMLVEYGLTPSARSKMKVLRPKNPRMMGLTWTELEGIASRPMPTPNMQ
jgi:P27 family predicted phage terminase small subunit